jgi:hypothetical protein
VFRKGLIVALAITLTAPASFAQQPRAELTPGFIQDSIEGIGVVIQREYFDPEAGRQVAVALRAGLSEGRFPNLSTAEDVVTAMNRELFFLTHDKHLVVSVVRSVPSAAVASGDRTEDVRRSNGGVQRVEILPGNVGYLNLTYFWRPAEADDAIATAMHALRNTDALILDMRANGGGSPETIAKVIGYLFDEPNLPLFNIAPRSGQIDHYLTPTAVSVDANGHRPTYVLTSSRTFSGGEGLAFLLQERKRAEVVGEVTAGAANPGRPYPVNETFQVTVPNGQVKSAVGGTNWEGKGVTPDFAVSTADALRVAHAKALARLIDAAPPGGWRDRLQREFVAIEFSR